MARKEYDKSPMTVIRLTDHNDPHLDIFRNLPTTKTERKVGRFLAEGMWLVRRLLESGWAVESLLVDEQRLDEIGRPIPDAVSVYVVPRGTAERVVGFNFHRGVIACGIRPPRASVRDLEGLEQREWLVPVCVEIQDPENLGSILRNAAALGAQAVVLGPNCADPLSRRVLRVSMGAPFFLPIAYCDDLQADLRWMRSSYGCSLCATVLAEDAERLHQVARDERMVLLFGNEGHGLPPQWHQWADRRITIPMSPRADSLNVAVASGIILHYLTFVAPRLASNPPIR